MARAVQSGAFAGLFTTATIAVAGAREVGNSVAPINATSHVMWGEEARRANAVDFKHTAPGLLINGAAAIFWAFAHESLLSALGRRDRIAVITSGAAVAALAYTVDYHLIPRRLTPGWELRLSRRSVATGFAVLGLSLALAALVRDGR